MLKRRFKLGLESILHQYIDNECNIFAVLNFQSLKRIKKILVKEDTSHTIGVEFGSKVANINNKIVNIQIWYKKIKKIL